MLARRRIRRQSSIYARPNPAIGLRIVVVGGQELALRQGGSLDNGAALQAASTSGLRAVFDGVSSALSFPTSPQYDVTGPITVGWFGTVTNFSDNRMMVTRANSNGATDTPFQLFAEVTTGKVNFYRANSGGFSGWICHDLLLTAGVYAAVFVTQTGDLSLSAASPNLSAKFYVNGVESTNTDQPSANTTGQAGTNTKPLLIGNRDDAFGPLLGDCDLCVVFDRVLTASEVADYSDIEGRWQMLASPVRRMFMPAASAANFAFYDSLVFGGAM